MKAFADAGRLLRQTANCIPRAAPKPANGAEVASVTRTYRCIPRYAPPHTSLCTAASGSYDFVKAHHHFSDPEWDGEPLEPEPVATGPRKPDEPKEPKEPKERGAGWRRH